MNETLEAQSGKPDMRANDEPEWVIRFGFPDEPIYYAGLYKDALGYAPQIETALKFSTEEAAKRMLANGYGESMQEFGTVVRR